MSEETVSDDKSDYQTCFLFEADSSPEFTRATDFDTVELDFESLASENEYTFEFAFANTRVLLEELEIETFSTDFAQLEIPQSGGKTVLHYVAESGNNETLLELLQQSPNVNVTQPLFHWTPLHYAAANGHLLTIRILIEAGAGVNCRNYYLETPLHMATNTAIARRKCIAI